MDINLRIRADALGLTAEDYEAERIDIDELYSGIARARRSPARVDRRVLHDGRARAADDGRPAARTSSCCCATATNPSHTRARPLRRATRKRVVPLRKLARGRVGHPPAQQGAALRARPAARRRHQAGHARRQGRHRQDAARHRRGPAEGRSRRASTSKLLVSRPIFPLGRDIGFLPGDVEEKLNPWMQPIFDNLEFLMGLVARPSKKQGRSYPELIDSGHHRDRAAHLHPRPLASRTSSSSSTRRRTSRRTR